MEYTEENVMAVAQKIIDAMDFLRFFTCMCSSVSFQVKSIIESFTTKCAQISFCITVALHVSIQQSL